MGTSMGVGTDADLKLCEAFETAHGDRGTSSKVRIALGSTQDFVRMDGMGKMCVLGAGAAEAILRLPPSGYREKIWDHAAGAHFVMEAGGRVSDLEGRGLDFGLGR
jgi:3'(2'), 5'-bisphosphate nucleotidase